jgi:hypothetical protein
MQSRNMLLSTTMPMTQGYALCGQPKRKLKRPRRTPRKRWQVKFHIILCAFFRLIIIWDVSVQPLKVRIENTAMNTALIMRFRCFRISDLQKKQHDQKERPRKPELTLDLSTVKRKPPPSFREERRGSQHSSNPKRISPFNASDQWISPYNPSYNTVTPCSSSPISTRSSNVVKWQRCTLVSLVVFVSIFCLRS